MQQYHSHGSCWGPWYLPLLQQRLLLTQVHWVFTFTFHQHTGREKGVRPECFLLFYHLEQGRDHRVFFSILSPSLGTGSALLLLLIWRCLPGGLAWQPLGKTRTDNYSFRSPRLIKDAGCRTRLAFHGLAELWRQVGMHRTCVSATEGQKEPQLRESSVQVAASWGEFGAERCRWLEETCWSQDTQPLLPQFFQWYGELKQLTA